MRRSNRKTAQYGDERLLGSYLLESTSCVEEFWPVLDKARRERKPRRPGYRDWRSGLVSIVWVLVLAFVVVQWPDYGVYAVVAFVVGSIVWRFAAAKGSER